MCKINQNLELESSVHKGITAIHKPKEKEKRRNNEKRKEKSRDAARCRRSRETEIFTELAASLPVKQEDLDHLDKASVMRLSISYLKIRNMVEMFPQINNLDIPIDVKSEKSDEEDEDTKDIKMNVLSKIIEDEKCALLALDGFLLVLNGEGDITFVSENITEYLGLSKIDLLGQPIWDYAHACDHDELRELLNGRKTSPSEVVNGSKSSDCNPLLHRNMMLRLKCTLTKSGRFVNIKSASYKVIHLTGHIVFKDDGYRQLLAVGKPLAHPSNIEIPLGSSTFLTKHTLDMKFSFVDSPKMFELMGYKPEHLLGKSVYEFHHGNDSENLMTSFKCLISKGQTETNRYRFLARNGGYVWIVTQATVVFEKQKPQSVVCVNYVISGIENENEIYSCAQLEAQQERSKAVEASPSAGGNLRSSDSSDTSTPPKVIKRDNIVLGISDLKQQQQKRASIEGAKNSKTSAKTVVVDKEKTTSVTTIKVNNCEIINSRPRSVTAAIFGHPTILTPQKKKLEVKIPIIKKAEKQIFRPLQQGHPTSVTSTIFAPRTKDMNPGYLMFSEDTDTGLTMLKDEPDDLTHLAPLAGDECIQLDESAPFFSDMFDDFIIPDNYNLLTDELNSLDSQCSSKSTAGSSSSSSCNDPFINYRDDSNDISNSPHLLSPGLSKSPDHSIPSLCSPGSLPEDEITFMTLNMDDDLDMSMRAPYISMSESSELPLLISDDLMWGAQPDIKQTLNINRKVDDTQNIARNNNNNNNQQFSLAGSTSTKNSSSFDSSLTSLLCNQFLQQHQSEQITLNKQHPEAVIRVIDDASMDNSTDEIASNIEWTMNDLLQLKKPLSSAKINIRDTTNGNINQTQTVETENVSVAVKKSTNHHKRPSISYEVSSKRAKGHDTTIKATPQLLQQLIATTGSNGQKARQKVTIQNVKSESRWSPSPNVVVEEKQQQKPAATNSVLMNLLVSGCDVPLTIDASQDFLENQESLTSPIVINDKMLSHSAVSPSSSAAANDVAQNSRQQPSNSSVGTNAYKTMASNEQRIIDAFGSFIDSDALNKILMDLNAAQDYEANLF